MLPWEYGVRNLFRRPGRSALTLIALTLVVLIVLVVVGFLRGLENSLAVSGDPRVVLIHAPGGGENIEQSAVPGRTGPVVAASVEAVQKRYGAAYVSPEIYLGTRVRPPKVDWPTNGLVRFLRCWGIRLATSPKDDTASNGLVRGVTPTAHLVRRQVQLIEGRWPGQGEVMVGRRATTKLGWRDEDLAVGQRIRFEGRTWTVVGRFAAGGSALEAEIWCPLEDLQQAMKRQDYSLVAVTIAPGKNHADVDEFCKERLDLEIQATPEVEYYAGLQKHYQPVRLVAWLVVLLVAGAGVFAGMNAMYGSVVGRVREFATLQTIGFKRRALVLSLLQESLLLSSAASLLASAVALVFLGDVAVRFTMGAFSLQVDGPALLIGCAVGLGIGLLGSIPPAIQALRLPVVEGLKAI